MSGSMSTSNIRLVSWPPNTLPRMLDSQKEKASLYVWLLCFQSQETYSANSSYACTPRIHKIYVWSSPCLWKQRPDYWMFKGKKTTTHVWLLCLSWSQILYATNKKQLIYIYNTQRTPLSLFFSWLSATYEQNAQNSEYSKKETRTGMSGSCVSKSNILCVVVKKHWARKKCLRLLRLLMYRYPEDSFLSSSSFYI